ncbi:hypothetical protein M4D79_02480 [Mycolicibacterium novocastrense]|nr:hypothetical protein M4D79_02480 [Mycolicibacterium novocastrense]
MSSLKEWAWQKTRRAVLWALLEAARDGELEADWRAVWADRTATRAAGSARRRPGLVAGRCGPPHPGGVARAGLAPGGSGDTSPGSNTSGDTSPGTGAARL